MSNTTLPGDTVTTAVKVNGSALPDTYDVLGITIVQAVNRISHAEIRILDGSAASEDFTISSGSTLVPGAKIQIEAGYNSKNKVVFEGIITGQTLRVDKEVGAAVCVLCKDGAVKMTVARNTALYNKKKDSDVMSTLVGNHSGLSSDITATSIEWPSMVQHYCTDWDFLLARAETCGMIVTTLANTVAVFPPDKNSTSVATITYGEELFSFDGELDATYQLKKVTASAWDPANQKLAAASASNSVAGPGNLSSSKLSDVLGLSDYDLQTSAPLEAAALTQWAKATMTKSQYAKGTGEVRMQGNADIGPGKVITLAGLGDRFNGDYLVHTVEHDISQGNWLIDAKLGLSHKWFIETPDVVAPKASGVLPGVGGLYNATVKKMYEDPDNAYRILIDLPLLDPAGEGIWARLTNFYSTSGAGAWFLPEVGDEVIVGFLNQDPRFPVILGSVYSAKNKPQSDYSPNQKNSPKAIVSKSELQVIFNDEDKILTLVTPSKNTVVLDDKNKQIQIKDLNENSITLSSSGIDIKSPKTINISADQTVNIKGQTGVNVEASGGDVSTKGLNIAEKASVGFTAEGSATATVKGGASLTLKAAMVMIN